MDIFCSEKSSRNTNGASGALNLYLLDFWNKLHLEHTKRVPLPFSEDSYISGAFLEPFIEYPLI